MVTTYSDGSPVFMAIFAIVVPIAKVPKPLRISLLVCLGAIFTVIPYILRGFFRSAVIVCISVFVPLFIFPIFLRNVDITFKRLVLDGSFAISYIKDFILTTVTVQLLIHGCTKSRLNGLWNVGV